MLVQVLVPQFPNLHLAVIDRKLRYNAFSEEPSMKKSSIKMFFDTIFYRIKKAHAREERLILQRANHTTKQYWHVCKREIREKMQLGQLDQRGYATMPF